MDTWLIYHGFVVLASGHVGPTGSEHGSVCKFDAPTSRHCHTVALQKFEVRGPSGMFTEVQGIPVVV